MTGRSWRDEWIDKIRSGEFFPVSNAFFKYKMKPIERCVYLYLVCAGGEDHKCYPSMQTIAKYCGCSKNAARDAVKMLVREGFISVTQSYSSYRGKNRQMNNLYQILRLPYCLDKPEKPVIVTAEELKARQGNEISESNEISEIYKDQLPQSETA